MLDFRAAWLALTDEQRAAYGRQWGEVDAMVEERMETRVRQFQIIKKVGGELSPVAPPEIGVPRTQHDALEYAPLWSSSEDSRLNRSECSDHGDVVESLSGEDHV